MYSFNRNFLPSVLLIVAVLGAPVSAFGSSKKCPAGSVAQLHIDVDAHTPFGTAEGSECHIGKKNDFPWPDPKCTPGAFNPSVTVETLTSKKFVTDCIRNKATSEKEKGKTYETYDVAHPSRADAGTCELDHLVPLELGGADTLDNIWPQCGTAESGDVYFRTKDKVETCIAKKVKAGDMDLDNARKKIAADWTQFLDECGAN